MKIKLIDYNWTPDSKETRVVGEHNIVEIKALPPTANGDKRSCVVMYKDNSRERIFNINRILYFGEEG